MHWPRGLLCSAALAALVATCGSQAAPRTAPPAPPAAWTNDACVTEGPAADYVRAAFADLTFALPREYEALHEPGALTNAGIWITPDSNMVFIGFDDAGLSVDRDIAEIDSEGRCTLAIAGAVATVDLFRVRARPEPDSVFLARTVLRIDLQRRLDVAVLGRTRAERARLLGSLATATWRRP
jgi:hypothetical protein